MLVAASNECGVCVSWSIVLIAGSKLQPCLQETGLHICQAFCIYRPLENSLSGSVDQAAWLLVIPTLFKSIQESWGLDRRASEVAIWLRQNLHKIKIRSRLCRAKRRLESNIYIVVMKFHCGLKTLLTLWLSMKTNGRKRSRSWSFWKAELHFFLFKLCLAIVSSFACSSLQANLQKLLIQTHKENRDLYFLSFKLKNLFCQTKRDCLFCRLTLCLNSWRLEWVTCFLTPLTKSSFHLRCGLFLFIFKDFLY